MADKHLDTALVNAGRSKIHPGLSEQRYPARVIAGFRHRRGQKSTPPANRANGELFYGRRGTLTHFSLQEAMCELEGGAGCALFPCGAAASG
ncbi:PLP-dependent transferase [Klebsiella pneumoniae subsp. pneumoniae]|nr:PLP-dependent transferase [Klebsiella pneumoniae subsp. pneumoniae]